MHVDVSCSDVICELSRVTGLDTNTQTLNLSQERDTTYACLLQKLSLSCVEWILKDVHSALKCDMHINHAMILYDSRDSREPVLAHLRHLPGALGVIYSPVVGMILKKGCSLQVL